MEINNKISALVITWNEENNIKQVIENLNFADEIIIVDSYSTDKTKDIINENKDIIFIENKFQDFTKQRNFAISHAKYPWILFIDADERITKSLKEEILNTLKNNNSASAFYFFRKFMFKNSPLHFSGWQTDKNIKLFKKDKAIYIIDRLVHEKLIVEGRKEKLKNKLIHFSYTDFESYKSKMIMYGKLKAKELHIKNLKVTLFHLYLKPLYKFSYSYLIRLGILDGIKGIIICYLNALSVYVTFKELKKLNNQLPPK
jgi:glycosyltransferase involved in cell wall biosynthesis